MDLLESKDKILIVDDSKLSVRILSDILKNMGYDVVSAYSAKEALSMATSERPSLIPKKHVEALLQALHPRNR